MNFLNVGPWELMVILAIAILLVGPRRVAEVVQTIGHFASQVRGMSGEFTSLLRSEIQTIEEDEPTSPTDSQTKTQDAKREAGGELQDIIKEGLAPIMSIQSELQATVQETRQAMESIVENGLGSVADIQTELQDAAQMTRQALDEPAQDGEPIADIQAELQATVQETRQVMESIAGGKSKPKEGQDEQEAEAGNE